MVVPGLQLILFIPLSIFVVSLRWGVASLAPDTSKRGEGAAKVIGGVVNILGVISPFIMAILNWLTVYGVLFLLAAIFFIVWLRWDYIGKWEKHPAVRFVLQIIQCFLFFVALSSLLGPIGNDSPVGDPVYASRSGTTISPYDLVSYATNLPTQIERKKITYESPNNTSKKVKVRDRPSSDGATIATLDVGSYVQVDVFYEHYESETDVTWLKVYFDDGRIGYMGARLFD